MQPILNLDSICAWQNSDYSNAFGIQNLSGSGMTYLPVDVRQVDKTPNKDTVEISNKPKMSKSKKILIGLGTASVAVASILLLKGKSADYITRAQKTFQETFMRDNITREETIGLLKEFKEILKIKNDDEFVKSLIENAKKNFGLTHLNFKIEKVDMPKGMASMSPDGVFSINRNLELKRDSLINIVFHEFRHAKQNELMCSKNSSRYLSGIFMRSQQTIKQKDAAFCQHIREIIKNLPESSTLSEREIEELVDFQLEQKWVKILKTNVVEKLGLGKSAVPENLTEYLEKCFEANAKYEDSGLMGYFFNFLERDARKSGEGMKSLLRSIPDRLE